MKQNKEEMYGGPMDPTLRTQIARLYGITPQKTWPMELYFFSLDILPILRDYKLTQEQAARLEEVLRLRAQEESDTI